MLDWCSLACGIACQFFNTAHVPMTLDCHSLFSPAMPCVCSPPGSYSASGASSCSLCPKGQYSPSSGLGDQQELVGSTIPCLRCPKGSIALKFDQSMNTNATIDTNDYRNGLALSDGADHCEAW